MVLLPCVVSVVLFLCLQCITRWRVAREETPDQR